MDNLYAGRERFYRSLPSLREGCEFGSREQKNGKRKGLLNLAPDIIMISFPSLYPAGFFYFEDSNMTEQEALIILNAVPGLGNIRIRNLLDYFGSAQTILKIPGSGFPASSLIPASVIKNILEFPQDNFLKKEYNLIAQNRARMLTCFDQEYPEILKEIPDAPVLLYYKGDLKRYHREAMAIVGSRRASVYGLMLAEQFASLLSDLGLVIVSGLAKGIDAAAHQGCLKARGTNAVVLGYGMSYIYPKENKRLMELIEESGIIFSEFPMDVPPLAHNFPRRNRIISGLSLGVLIVEASRKSGALITSRCALEQGREVFAIPGPIDHPNTAGVHDLIKQGAKLVTSIEDILEELPLLTREQAVSQGGEQNFVPRFPGKDLPARSEPVLTEEEKLIYQNLTDQPIHLEELALRCGLPLEEALDILLRLEVGHLIQQRPGKLFSLCI